MPIERITFHPAYLANRETYKRHRAWLDSTPQALAEYLFKTFLEEHDDHGKYLYSERVELLDTDNKINALLTIHFAELTQEEPSWNGMDSDQAQSILKDIDGKRKTTWKFAKEVVWQLLWAGFAPVETFAPKKSGERMIDALLSGERSYSRLYEPDDLVAWEWFDDDGPMRGQLKKVVFRNRIATVEKKRGNDQYQTYKVLWIENPGEKYRSQVVRAKCTLGSEKFDGYIDVKPDPERGEEKQGGLQFLPVTLFGDPLDGVKNTLLFHAAYDARIKLNKQSQYDQATRYNSSPHFIISKSRNAQQDALHLGVARIGVVEGDISVHTLEAADPQPLWRDIQRLEQSIRQKILLQPNQAVNPESRETPSVDSKRADHDVRSKFYNDFIDEVQFGLEYLFGWVHAGFEPGTIPKEGVGVTFTRDFSMKDYETELQETTMRHSRASSMGKAGAKYRKRLFINDVTKTRFETVEGENEEEVRQEIIEEALAQPDEEPVSDLQQALFRRRQERFGKGPAEEPTGDTREPEAGAGDE